MSSLAICGDYEHVEIVSSNNGSSIMTCQTRNNSKHIEFFNKTMFSVTQSRLPFNLSLFDLEHYNESPRKLEGHNDCVYKICLVPGQYEPLLGSVSIDETLRIWDRSKDAGKEEVGQYKAKYGLRCCLHASILDDPYRVFEEQGADRLSDPT